MCELVRELQWMKVIYLNMYDNQYTVWNYVTVYYLKPFDFTRTYAYIDESCTQLQNLVMLQQKNQCMQ